MLKKKYRLKRYSAFIATYKINNMVFDKNIRVYFGKSKTDDSVHTKFAFVVSKKIHKRAVVRNRIKRLMRESVRLIIENPEYKFLHNYLSVIFVAKHSAIDASYKDISCSVRDLVSRNRCMH